MKSAVQFVRTTVAGGVLFLVPIIVLTMILGKALSLAHRLVDPVVAHIPFHSIIGLRTPVFMAIVLLVAFCFLAGVVARTAFARKLIHALEEAVLSRLPGYDFLKGISESLLGAEPKAYGTVLARIEDAWQIGFLVERLENGFVAVFIPDAPNPRSGAVFLMTADRIVPAPDVPPTAAMKCLRRLGAGSSPLLRALGNETATRG